MSRVIWYAAALTLALSAPVPAGAQSSCPGYKVCPKGYKPPPAPSLTTKASAPVVAKQGSGPAIPQPGLGAKTGGSGAAIVGQTGPTSSATTAGARKAAASWATTEARSKGAEDGQAPRPRRSCGRSSGSRRIQLVDPPGPGRDLAGERRLAWLDKALGTAAVPSERANASTCVGR